MTLETRTPTSRLFYMAEDGFKHIRHVFIDEETMLTWLDITTDDLLAWRTGESVPPIPVLQNILHLAHFAREARRFNYPNLLVWVGVHDDMLGSTPLEAVRARRGATALNALRIHRRNLRHL